MSLQKKFSTKCRHLYISESYSITSTHRSTEELEAAIEHYIATVNAEPRPFRWTQSANDIVATIKRWNTEFCLRTLETADRQNIINKTSESEH